MALGHARLAAALLQRQKIDEALQEQDRAVKEFEKNVKQFPELGDQLAIAKIQWKEIQDAAVLVADNFSKAQITGTLSRNDVQMPAPSGAFARMYPVRLEEGKQYQFDMIGVAPGPRGANLDPYLRLEDNQGKPLALDNNGGGGRDARLVFRCRGTAPYRIVATSNGPGQTGDYVLTVQATEPTPPLSLPLDDGHGDIKSTLTGTDPKDRLRIGSVCKITLVKLKAGAIYQIDTIAKDFTPILRVEDAEENELAQHEGSILTARLWFACPRDGVYRIVSAAAEEKTGPFTLSIRSAVPPTLVLKDDEADADGLLTPTDLNDRVNTSSLCKIYRVKLSADTIYHVEMTGDKIPEATLRVEDGKGKSLAGSVRSQGSSKARAVFQCLQEGIYEVIATSSSVQTGPFALRYASLFRNPACR